MTGSAVCHVGPTMVRLFDADGQLVPEARPFDEGSLLSVEADTLLPVWWPEADEDGVVWSPRQRVQAFEHDLRAWMRVGPSHAMDEEAQHSPDVARIVAALRRLHESVPI